MPRVEVFNRDEVLQKVTDLFWNKGFNGTSMQDLVDVTGLNRSSIYNSFGNKRALYEMVLKQYHKDSKDFLQSALHKAEHPLDAIHKIFDNILQSILDDAEGKGCFGLNCKTELSRADKEIKLLLRNNEEGTIKLFKDLVEEGQRHGSINERDTPENYAYYLFSAFQGLRMTGILMNDKEKLQKIIDNTLQTLE